MITSYKELYQAVSTDQKPVGLAIVNPQHDYLFETLQDAEQRHWIIPHIFNDDDPEKAARNAVESVAEGQAQLLMKGDLDTATLMKTVMKGKPNLRTNRLLSHIAVVEIPTYPRLMLMTDGGVNIDLSLPAYRDIIENALQLTSALGIIHPNLALLALIEKVTDKLPETGLAHRVIRDTQTDPRFTIEGPVALDIALSENAAVAKNVNSEIAGKTDVFLGPNITAVNFTVKGLMSLGGVSGGGIILGAKVPIVLLSRSDHRETKLNSIALGRLMLQNLDSGK